MTERPAAVVAGVGPGLGAALCRMLAREGYAVAGLARGADTGAALARELDGALRMWSCDVTDPEAVARAFPDIRTALGAPAVLIYNAGAWMRRAAAEATPEEFESLWRVNAFGAFLCTREVVPDMLARGTGTLIYTGATASVKPGARFSAFGAAKSALRGMAQGLARELAPQGIHVAHVVIDGVIWTERTRARLQVEEWACLRPEAIAQSYLHLIRQDRSAWTFELDLRPHGEPF